MKELVLNQPILKLDEPKFEVPAKLKLDEPKLKLDEPKLKLDEPKFKL